MLATREWVKSLLRKLNIGKYSNDEKRIGTWIDGKPIYQKTIVGKTPPRTGINTVIADVSSWNIDKVISFEGIFMPGGSTNIPINYYFSSNNYAMVHINDQSELTMILGFSEQDNKDVYITVRYTKTTD